MSENRHASTTVFLGMQRGGAEPVGMQVLKGLTPKP